MSGFGGSQGSPDLLNSGTQEAQGPSCEKSFNREELIAGGRSRVVPLLLCPPARVPSVAIWAVLEEILEFSYSGAFPRLALAIQLLPKKVRGHAGAQPGDASCASISRGFVWGSLLLCALMNAQTMQTNRAVNMDKVREEQSLLYSC